MCVCLCVCMWVCVGVCVGVFVGACVGVWCALKCRLHRVFNITSMMQHCFYIAHFRAFYIFLQYYNFTSFAMMLNELDDHKASCAPTDSRFRPDMRLMEASDVGMSFFTPTQWFRREL